MVSKGLRNAVAGEDVAVCTVQCASLSNYWAKALRDVPRHTFHCFCIGYPIFLWLFI